MVKIQPVQIWTNGIFKNAEWLSVVSSNDNLIDSATFSYSLNDDLNGVPNVSLSNGYLTIDGQDYINWNNDSDINAAAYQWVANQLSLTIIP